MSGILQSMFGGGGGRILPLDDNSIGNQPPNNSDQQQNNQNPSNQQQNNQNQIPDEELTEEERRRKALQAIYGEENQEADDEDNDPPPNEEDTPQAKAANAMAKKIAGMLQSTTLGADVIPENFDPTDPKQMLDVLNKSNQKTIMAAVQIAMQPVEAAIQQLSTDMVGRIESSLNNFSANQHGNQVLAQLVPEANDPELKGLVKDLYARGMKKKGATPDIAAKSVRAALDAMGLSTSQSNPKRTSGSEFGGGFKSGSDALDAFAPLPKQTRR